MKAKDIAKTYFDRIGEGHRSAVRRPFNNSVDRFFRKLIEEANCNGDCIIPRKDGKGYYRPLPHDPIDRLEYTTYMANERSREDSIHIKLMSMQVAYTCRVAEGERWLDSRSL